MSLTYDMTGTEQIKIKITAFHTLREVFAEEKMKIGKIILFGSRARGDYVTDVSEIAKNSNRVWQRIDRRLWHLF